MRYEYNKIKNTYLYKEYIQKNKSIKVIAKENNTSVFIIRKYLKKFNIQVRKPGFKPLFEDLSNKKFNMLKVTDESFVKGVGYKSKRLWKCVCDCGNITTVSTNDLKNGHTRSCGCLKYKIQSESPVWQGYGNISKNYFTKIKNTAKKGDRKFNLNIKYLSDLFDKQHGLCALSGLKIDFGYGRSWRRNNTASLDRIDSSKGYIKNNVQWVHKDINRMKSNFEQNKFIQYCYLIGKYNDK